jgi:CheY-like chemotaxis protein
MQKHAPTLLAESDADDIELLRRAFEKARITNPVIVVKDGQEAIDYLAHRGNYQDRHKYPSPCLMLLDLKMPRVDGTEVLTWWKDHNHHSNLPIIVLTSSANPSKIEELMRLGATDYRSKPHDFDGLIAMAQELRFGWIEKGVRKAA